MARKTKLTEELIENVRTSLQNHNTKKTTAELVGISQQTFYMWLNQGEKARSGLKREFYETVKQAQAMSIVHLTNQIAKDPAWQAKAWLLERMHPKQYGRRQLLAHAGADGESDLPTAQPATLNIIMQGDIGDHPWEFSDEQDPEPENGSEPWDSDHVRWHGQDPVDGRAAPPEPSAARPEPPSPTPSRGPELPGRRPDGKPHDPDA